ncbi:MAG: SDR family oxidoreductase [Deltaproteobacteria bacterium]|nr:SDR family oxidoreductase [Deltaproteobacteria bacterium]
MEKNLQGKTAFITGSSRGIGKSIALKLAAQGANIILHYRRNLEEVTQVESEIQKMGVQVFKYAADLSDLEEVKSLLDSILKNHTQLDIFIANAAATAFKPLVEIKEHHIFKTFNITISTFILAVNTLRTLMPRGSKIITISGIDTKKYCFNHGLLAAAKSALETLTRYYAIELAKDEIYVQGINPGLVDTDSMKFYFGEGYEKAKAEMSALIPQGGMMPPADVAELISFLCTSPAQWMNGETLYADGGLGFLMPTFSMKPH